MSVDSVLNEDTVSTSLPAHVTDDSCIFEFTETLPLTRDTDGRNTTECDSGDWSAQVKQENLSTDNVCFCLSFNRPYKNSIIVIDDMKCNNFN